MGTAPAERPPNLDDRLRTALEQGMPYRTLLPGVEPVYVHRWTYLFGAGAVCGFILLLVSGVLLALRGPDWWQESGLGLFVNSVHFSSVQLFFFMMVAHLVCQFLMATYRGNRKLTWVMGALAFFAAIVTAFTGYLSQMNFEAQWVATQGKDAFNALGVGWFFNLMDTGQMLTMHVVVLPVAVAVLVAVHVLLVRRRGVCPPYDAREEDLGPLGAPQEARR